MLFSLLSALGLWLAEGIGFLTGFVTSGSAFPKPLRPEEEKELLMQKKQATKAPTSSLSGTFAS